MNLFEFNVYVNTLSLKENFKVYIFGPHLNEISIKRVIFLFVWRQYFKAELNKKKCISVRLFTINKFIYCENF